MPATSNSRWRIGEADVTTSLAPTLSTCPDSEQHGHAAAVHERNVPEIGSDRRRLRPTVENGVERPLELSRRQEVDVSGDGDDERSVVDPHP
jgi:hypothetical protein